MKVTIESKTNILPQIMDGEKGIAFRAEMRIQQDNQEIIALVGTDDEAEIYAINMVFYNFCHADLQRKLDLTPEQLISLCKAVVPFFEASGYKKSTIKKEEARIVFDDGKLAFMAANAGVWFTADTVKEFLLAALDDHKVNLGLIVELLEDFLSKQGTSSRSFSVEI